jgi:hypothetical protein
MGEAVAVAAERDTLLNLLLYPAPAITMIHHVGYVPVFIANVVKL